MNLFWRKKEIVQANQVAASELEKMTIPDSPNHRGMKIAGNWFFAIFLKANFIIDLILMLPLNEVFFFGFSHFFAAWGSSLLYILPEAAAAAKGQLISECLFDVLHFPKKQRKI